MKNRFILSLVAVAAIFASCQNQQKNNQTGDSTMNADTPAHTMTPAAGEADSAMKTSMSKMMENMHQLKKSGNADHDLAVAMREHHKGAVDMASVELEKGSDSELKKMAQKIKDMQGKEVDDLDKLISKYKDAQKNYDPENTDQGLGKAMSDNMMSMMQMPQEKAAGVDHEFAMMMAKHHADGIKMGQAILQYAKDPMFKSMTEKMIADQQNEITEFQKWMAANSNQ
ncbi:DUF305 domain-containing protein [Mucilaginibacter myungsuensis]|uniref:DUF305 domain-containing protein n=1 Tax=Mucilaginibacter myungsuensis TaxID=649104 RepID=A0A929PXA6_9SPHI|nr:DUF305 domain-containing protein [Mucilaginibacter myungsuensis]MBE9662976.1 DUF305 domain-containing protein [Mucilaginibacter myungsuensis]MDN3598604.1 DUF305 domain-containing protein [Mucilaginibacter myungsuensis]